ncbi:hypothetical protein JW964_17690 [candidate division KSB1 bacterium]|nr:hypothetical protein [candidate division KSB1 bacterium]
MQRIEKITLKNFKFFYGEVPIEIEGKNILLYGENGSGKSCIYYAIYTFLQSILKTKDAEISKYFDAGKSENLINHFALDEESFIKVQFRAEDGTLTEKTISKDVINTKSDTMVKEASYASDLMNYKLLSKMHNFHNKEEIEWFKLFESEVLPFINFREPFVHYTGTTGNNNAADWWTFLNKNKPDEYYKNSDEYKSFQWSIQKFNNELKFFWDTITETANDILNNQFKQNFKITFDLTGFSYVQSYPGSRYRSSKNPILKIKVELNHGSLPDGHTTITKPHIFLNEAKLTAIALSVRFAILKQKYITQAPKILVLDDLLISLDMSHRNTVLDYILSEFSDYQMIIMTHDKHFFELMKNKINKLQQNDWKYLEIYETEKDSIPQPLILESETHLQKAERFFRKKEYEAAGNFLRKEAENFCREFLPKRRQFSRDFKLLNLDGLINQCICYARESGLDLTLFQNLVSHRKFVFNPLSHDSYDVPRFNSEVSSCIDTLKELRKIQFKTILRVNDKLEFELTAENGTDVYKFEITIQDEFKLIQLPGAESILGVGMINYFLYKNGDKSPLQHKKQSLKKMYDSCYNKSDQTKSNDFWEEIIVKNTGNKLNSLRDF